MKQTAMVFLLLFAANVTAQDTFDVTQWYGYVVEVPRPAIDHSVYDEFLSTYMVIESEQWGRHLDYASVSDFDYQQLQSYIAKLQAIDPRFYPYDNQLAYWLNLHNAVVIESVLSEEPLLRAELNALARAEGYVSHRDRLLVTVAGQQLSLNNIVDDILLGIWQVPEIYFLAHCAGIDCPSLTRSALKPNTVQGELQRAMTRYSSRPSSITIDESGQLYLAAHFAKVTPHFAEKSDFMKRIAFSVDDRLALSLLGYNGSLSYASNGEIHAAVWCQAGGARKLVYAGDSAIKEGNCEHY